MLCELLYLTFVFRLKHYLDVDVFFDFLQTLLGTVSKKNVEYVNDDALIDK